LATKTIRNTKIGRKVVRATGDIQHQFQGQRSKIKVTRPFNFVTKDHQYLHMGRPASHHTWA